MRKAPFLIATILVAATTALPAPVYDGAKDSSKPNYRLPDSIVPKFYTLNLTFFDDTFSTQKFNGTVTIKIEVKNATKQIVLNSMSTTTINNITVLSENNTNVQLEDKDNEFDNVTEILKINVKDPGLANQSYTLVIDYTGTLQTDDMYGFYKSSYEEDGKTKYLAATQFEPTHARRAFPCFDEPRFKTNFNFTITYPVGYTARFNTEVEAHQANKSYITEKFLMTPPMATYLVAFLVSEFDSTTSTEKIDGLYEHKVWSRKSLGAKRQLASNLGPVLFQALENFTGITLTNMTLKKMDQAAIPDFSAGAMENWGLVTFREIYLLSDEDTTTRANQSAASVIAHEFSHHWFGDYVTLNWWSELWLNEGFATYFEYHIPDKVLDDSQAAAQFVTNELQTAMVVDSATSAHPISDEDDKINTPAEIQGKFDGISYNKAGSILRMLRHILGDDLFQKGLRTYLNEFHFKNVKGSDFWQTIDSVVPEGYLPYKVSDIMTNWTRKAGFPILHVSMNGKNLTFTQERYLRNETAKDNTTWYIPISYTDSIQKNFNNTQPRLWLQPGSKQTVQLDKEPDWMIVNIQESGYYRVNYDSASWTKIANLLNKNHEVVHVINRAQIVDDIMNLAQIGKVNYEKVFEVIGYLKNEKEYLPWVPAIKGYNYLLMRTRKTKLEGALKDQLRGMMQNVFNSVSSTNANLRHVDKLKQELIWNWACALDNKNCTKQAEDLVKQIHNKSVPVDLRTGVYCSAIRTSTGDQTWKYFWNRFLNTSSSSEKVVILGALGCSKNTTILKDYLNKSVTKNSGIRMQDSYSVFAAVTSGNPEGISIAFDFMVENWDKITDYYKGFNALAKLLDLLGGYLSTNEELTKFQGFVTAKNITGELKKSADHVVESIKVNQQWTKQYSEQLLKIFHLDDNSAGIISSHVILVLVSVFVFMLY